MSLYPLLQQALAKGKDICVAIKNGNAYYNMSDLGIDRSCLFVVLRVGFEKRINFDRILTTRDKNPKGSDGGIYNHIRRIKGICAIEIIGLGNIPLISVSHFEYWDLNLNSFYRWSWTNPYINFPGIVVTRNSNHVHRLYMYFIYKIMKIKMDENGTNGPVAAALVDGQNGLVKQVALKSMVCDPYHAEVNLIEFLGHCIISEPILYVTMKPCDMCRGVINDVFKKFNGFVCYVQEDPGITTPLDFFEFPLIKKPPRLFDESNQKRGKKAMVTFLGGKSEERFIEKETTFGELKKIDASSIKKLTSTRGKQVILQTSRGLQLKSEKYRKLHPITIEEKNHPEVAIVSEYLQYLIETYF